MDYVMADTADIRFQRVLEAVQRRDQYFTADIQLVSACPSSLMVAPS